MTDEKYPIAWLPAHSFLTEAERRYEDLLRDLCAVGKPFTFKCWDWDGYQYQHSVDAFVVPSNHPQGSAVIELRVTKRYQSTTEVKAMEELKYKRPSPNSTSWTRTMLGKPSPSALANHTLAGIKFAAGFKPNMGFKIAAESAEIAEDLTRAAKGHGLWGMPSTGELRFLNT
jgi:hypothetical protein